MKKILFTYIALTVAFILSTRSTYAYIATKLFSSATHVVVTPVWEYNLLFICDEYWAYKQLMIIDGHPGFVFTQSIYGSGRMDLDFNRTCDEGYFIYGLASCGCLTDKDTTLSIEPEFPSIVNPTRTYVIIEKLQQQPNPSAFIDKMSKDILKPKDCG